MKYLKTIGLEIILIISLALFYSVLYYFNITGNKMNYFLKIISFIVIFLVTGINIGKNSKKKGFVEGLKISGITIILFILISFLFKYNFNIKQFIYYLLCTVTITLGSILGINFKKNRN